MLPSNYRLAYKSFLYKNKNPLIRKDTTLFLYRFKKASPEKNSRVVFVVPKKLSKLANKRNRTKRVLSEVFFHFLPNFKNGYWLSVQSKKLFISEKPKDLYMMVEKDLQQIGLL